MDSTKEVIYIAGKMRGISDLGRSAFAEAEDCIWAWTANENKNRAVLNPAILPTNLPDDAYLPICLAMLDKADAIWMIDGWENSEGANVELAFAKAQRKTIYYTKCNELGIGITGITKSVYNNKLKQYTESGTYIVRTTAELE